MKERGSSQRGLIRHPVTLEPRARGVAGRALISDGARDSNSYRFKDVVLPSLYFSPLILPLVESNSNDIKDSIGFFKEALFQLFFFRRQ